MSTRKTKPSRGEVGQQFDHLATQAREEVEVVDALARAGRGFAVGFAGFRVDEDEIDVGTDIQLASAQLSHAELLRLARGRARRAVAGGERCAQHAGGVGHRLVGQGGHGLGYLGQVGEPRQVAGDQAGHHPGAQAAQAGAQRRLVARFRGQGLAHGLRAEGEVQAGAQRLADLRPAGDQPRQEAGQGQDGFEPRGVVGRVVHSDVIGLYDEGYTGRIRYRRRASAAIVA
jgi:hypothetical protein